MTLRTLEPKSPIAEIRTVRSEVGYPLARQQVIQESRLAGVLLQQTCETALQQYPSRPEADREVSEVTMCMPA